MSSGAKGLLAKLAPSHAQSVWGFKGGKGSNCRVGNIL